MNVLQARVRAVQATIDLHERVVAANAAKADAARRSSSQYTADGDDVEEEIGSVLSGSSGGHSVTGRRPQQPAEQYLTVEEEAKQVEHLNWWCREQLRRCLQKLRRLPEARYFLEPVPWEDVGLLDYPEIIKDPMDLKTLEELLVEGEYYTDEGTMDPSSFWEDVALCWENCMLYYEGDEEADPYKMAQIMAEEAAVMEEEFWDDLQNFERSIEKLAPSLGMAGAAVDVAGAALGDTMHNVYHDGKAAVENLASAMSAWLGNGEDQEEKSAQRLPLRVQHPEDPLPSLHEHFTELLAWEFGSDASKDLLDLQTSVVFRLRASWPVADQLEEEDVFPEAKDLLPIEELVPVPPSMQETLPESPATSVGTRSTRAHRNRSRRRRERSDDAAAETCSERSMASSAGALSTSSGLVVRRQIRRPRRDDTGSSFSPRGSEASIGSRSSRASRSSRTLGRMSRAGSKTSAYSSATPDSARIGGVAGVGGGGAAGGAATMAMCVNDDGLFEF